MSKTTDSLLLSLVDTLRKGDSYENQGICRPAPQFFFTASALAAEPTVQSVNDSVNMTWVAIGTLLVFLCTPVCDG
ncbi:hypothetical protein PO124_10715 [Bacillus licheniformis]|nr:hypothetical protein [Bacillus licheniformis]